MRSVFLLFAALGLLMSSGCYYSGRYTPPSTPDRVGEFRKPEEDLARLRELFNQRGGALYDPATEVEVAWRDYGFFRVYQFSQHSIVVYPANWDDKHHNIHVYAGQLQHNNRLLNLIHKRGGGKYGWYFDPALELNGDLFKHRDVGMDGAFLGQTREQYIESMMNSGDVDVYFHGSKEELLIGYEMSFDGNNGTRTISRIHHDNIRPKSASVSYHEVILEGNRVVNIQYIAPTDGGPMLGQFAINKPETKVVHSGIITLSHE